MSLRRRRSGFYRSIPRTSRIGHYDYAIEKLPEPLAEDDWGDCDSVLKRIRLWAGMTTGELAEYWLHENLHGIWNQNCIPVKGEEEIVEPLAKALVKFFHDNPDALDWWVRAVKASRPKT